MAKVITTDDGVTHLRADTNGNILCGAHADNQTVTDGVLTCPKCAAQALLAVELVTKAEKREWRQL